MVLGPGAGQAGTRRQAEPRLRGGDRGGRGRRGATGRSRRRPAGRGAASRRARGDRRPGFGPALRAERPAQGHHRGDVLLGPAPAGALQPGLDDQLVGALHDAAADGQALRAKRGIAHLLQARFEVAQDLAPAPAAPRRGPGPRSAAAPGSPPAPPLPSRRATPPAAPPPRPAPARPAPHTASATSLRRCAAWGKSRMRTASGRWASRKRWHHSAPSTTPATRPAVSTPRRWTSPAAKVDEGGRVGQAREIRQLLAAHRPRLPSGHHRADGQRAHLPPTPIDQRHHRPIHADLLPRRSRRAAAAPWPAPAPPRASCARHRPPHRPPSAAGPWPPRPAPPSAAPVRLAASAKLSRLPRRLRWACSGRGQGPGEQPQFLIQGGKARSHRPGTGHRSAPARPSGRPRSSAAAAGGPASCSTPPQAGQAGRAARGGSAAALARAPSASSRVRNPARPSSTAAANSVHVARGGASRQWAMVVTVTAACDLPGLTGNRGHRALLRPRTSPASQPTDLFLPVTSVSQNFAPHPTTGECGRSGTHYGRGTIRAHGPTWGRGLRLLHPRALTQPVRRFWINAQGAICRGDACIARAPSHDGPDPSIHPRQPDGQRLAHLNQTSQPARPVRVQRSDCVDSPRARGMILPYPSSGP